MQNAKYWLLTIPYAQWTKPDSLPDYCQYIAGQHERGESGYEHWQVLVCLNTKQRLSFIKTKFGGQCHAEPAKSQKARDYVLKEESRVGEQFQYGDFPFRRNTKTDWDAVYFIYSYIGMGISC